jgi:hypothetical protein
MSGVARPVTGPIAGPIAGPIGGPINGAARPVRRVRHEVRDGLVLMAFSAVTSVGLAGLLTVLAGLGK